MILRLRHTSLDLSTPRIMGVLNVTPDSFSDGGRFATRDTALAQARRLIAEGADLLDIGGESTRPGAQPVGEQEELDRVLPVIEALRNETPVPLSIDTMKPAVMRAALDAGASMINDVNALQGPGAIDAARESGAAVCLMHMQGEPRTMQAHPVYADVQREVAGFLAARASACEAAGIAREAIVIDPGFGFGKRLEHNLVLLGRLERLAALGYPVLVGLSRKSMFGQIVGASVDQRLPGGLAAAAIAVEKGARIVRTHDVAATRDAVRVAHAIREAGEEHT